MFQLSFPWQPSHMPPYLPRTGASQPSCLLLLSTLLSFSSLPVCILLYYQSAHRWWQPLCSWPINQPFCPWPDSPETTRRVAFTVPCLDQQRLFFMCRNKAGGCSSSWKHVSQTAVWWSNTVCDSTCCLSTRRLVFSLSAWKLACNGNCRWFIKQRSESIFTFMSGQHPAQQPAGGRGWSALSTHLRVSKWKENAEFAHETCETGTMMSVLFEHWKGVGSLFFVPNSGAFQRSLFLTYEGM